MSDFATAGGHWYLPDGSPYYTVVGANGKERAVTLRDARKVMARPSVTGIIRCAAAPDLLEFARIVEAWASCAQKGQYIEWMGVEQSARAVIAKATGAKP